MEFKDLRPPQKRAVEMLRRSWKVYQKQVLGASVAFGKTAFGAYLAKQFADKGMRVLFIAPYTVLIDQTVERFRQYGLPECGIIWRDHPDYDPEKQIQIASADTLIRREFPDVDLVIWDECHIKRKALLEEMGESKAHWIGLSGTPFANWMGAHWENLIKPTTMRKLIDEGWLSDYEFYAPSKPDMSGYKTSNTANFGQDYKEKDAAEAMDKPQVHGDIVQNWLENGKNLPTIAFCVNVAHANHICSEFNRCGVQAEVMTAKTPQEDRKEIIKRYEEGHTKIICNVGVLVAGFDSDVRCIIYARPTKSEIRWIQCLGRGLRKAEGKDKCLIFDHSGSVHNLGFPDHIEYETLQNKDDGMKENQSVKRQIEKAEKLPKECPKCHFMKPAGSPPKCPRCGYMPLAGEDVNTDKEAKLKSLNSKIQEPATHEEKQRFYSELKGYQRERRAAGKAIKDGWVAHKYREKFGVWPRSIDQKKVLPVSVETRNWLKSTFIKYSKRK